MKTKLKRYQIPKVGDVWQRNPTCFKSKIVKVTQRQITLKYGPQTLHIRAKDYADKAEDCIINGSHFTPAK